MDIQTQKKDKMSHCLCNNNAKKVRREVVTHTSCFHFHPQANLSSEIFVFVLKFLYIKHSRKPWISCVYSIVYAERAKIDLFIKIHSLY